jgi:hypothetical protein
MADMYIATDRLVIEPTKLYPTRRRPASINKWVCIITSHLEAELPKCYTLVAIAPSLAQSLFPIQDRSI